jgi:ABC-type glutathione transport system ATPase component
VGAIGRTTTTNCHRARPRGQSTNSDPGPFGFHSTAACALTAIPAMVCKTVGTEATSALDPDSERVIRDQMSTICEGRTVIIISHRMSAVRNADRIIAMDRGRIVEVGSHQELSSRLGGYYAHLVAIQNS